MKTLKNFILNNQRALVRCDFNVPLDEKGDILDDFRIRQAIPTIKYLVEKKAKIILMSHLGDPQGKAVPELKMDKVAEKISDILQLPVIKVDECIGPEAESRSKILDGGDIMILENLRFYEEEIKNDSDFSKKLSFLGDIYVNEAFSVCHRAHASVAGTPQFLTHCAGLLLEKEIDSLDKIFKNPERPMITIIGGKKVETKSKFINKASRVSDFVIVSGLLKKEIIEKKIEFDFPEKIIGPINNFDALDIDEKTINLFKDKIMQAKTVLWNGPFGKFEDKKYARGTLEIAKTIITSGAYSVAGGGETVEFIEKQGMMDKFSHVSTGGGAMLAYLGGEEMPGLEALK